MLDIFVVNNRETRILVFMALWLYGFLWALRADVEWKMTENMNEKNKIIAKQC